MSGRPFGRPFELTRRRWRQPESLPKPVPPRVCRMERTQRRHRKGAPRAIASCASAPRFAAAGSAAAGTCVDSRTQGVPPESISPFMPLRVHDLADERSVSLTPIAPR